MIRIIVNYFHISRSKKLLSKVMDQFNNEYHNAVLATCLDIYYKM